MNLIWNLVDFAGWELNGVLKNSRDLKIVTLSATFKLDWTYFVSLSPNLVTVAFVEKVF